MPSDAAVSAALAASRDAMASMRLKAPRCMAGITFSRAILAVLRTPQETVWLKDSSVKSFDSNAGLDEMARRHFDEVSRIRRVVQGPDRAAQLLAGGSAVKCPAARVGDRDGGE